MQQTSYQKGLKPYRFPPGAGWTFFEQICTTQLCPQSGTKGAHFMDNMFWIGFLGAAVAGIFAVMQAKKVLSYSEGTDRMQKLAKAIREGADAYLKQQYSTVFKVFAVVFAALLAMAFATDGQMLSKFTPFAFLSGGIFSMLAGFVGMKIATNSNARTAYAASESLNRGLRVAFSSGSVMGLPWWVWACWISPCGSFCCGMPSASMTRWCWATSWS